MLFLGPFRSGKSTTITYLIGHSFEKKFKKLKSGRSQSKGIGLVDTAIDLETIPKMGDGGGGGGVTDFPQLYKDPSATPLAYCDLEGRNGPCSSGNEIEKRMINLFAPYALIKMARVKAIALMFPYNGLDLAGADTIRSIFELLSAYFSLEELQKGEVGHSICLTITHAPRFQGDDKKAEKDHIFQLQYNILNRLMDGYGRVLQDIKNAKKGSAEKDRLKKIKQCFAFFVDGLGGEKELKYHKILFVFPTDQGESRAEMKKFFLAAPGIAPASLRPFDTAQAYWLTQSLSQFTPKNPQEEALRAIWDTHFRVPTDSVKQSWKRALPQKSTASSGKPTPDGVPRIEDQDSVGVPSLPDNGLRKYLKFIPVGMLAIALLLLLYRVVTSKKEMGQRSRHASKEHSASVETEEDL